METRTPHGSIAICNRNERLWLQFPRAWFNHEQKYLSLKLPDTKGNRAYAEGLIVQMEWDYPRGEFDRTYAKYIQSSIEEKPKDLSISELWSKYCDYKTPDRKAATIHYLIYGIGSHLRDCPYQEIDRSLEIRGWLMGRTSPDMAKRVIQSLATVIKWGTKHGLIAETSNPFVGMAEDIRVEPSEPAPNAFTTDETLSILTAFENSRYYACYLPLVRFWLLCGCRPSEGIGLEWEQVSQDCSEIRFDRSIIHIAGKPIYNQNSKTNRKRTFPCQKELQELLLSQKQRRTKKTLVFSSPNGLPIDYKNFSIRAWVKTLETVIDRPSTPYSCRDTFITRQIAKGVPIALIAKWVDNSAAMIEKYYLDPTAISNIRPQ
jgi:integrase